MKTIAIDLDDTLNDFTATLQGGEFVRDGRHALSAEVFGDYLAKVRRGWDGGGELLSTEYTYFRYRIHHEVYGRARARPDAAPFLRWLRAHGWRIVICTRRDLRRAQAATRQWLGDHDLPFDHLFMAGNKIVFCRLWGIAHLIDDDAFAIAHGERHGVSVYHPAAEPGPLRAAPAARGFRSFEEIIPWIQG
jgi:hypothetical protein